MVIVGNASLQVFVVGFVVGLALLGLLYPKPGAVRWRRLPDQLLASALYTLMLFRDILLSGIDVARRVLSPDMGLKPGIITISTQDETRSPTVLALSADYITLTPGELVIEVKDNHLMVVHCLDVDDARAGIEAEQAARLRLLKRMLGRDA
jgi:multisubunit Na+/H+ antiporter MnhE subunit